MTNGTFTYGVLPDPPPRELLDELRTFEVAWISDSMDLYLMDPEIAAVHPGVPRIAGPAVTVTVPPGDFLMIPAALKTAREGDVLVIDARGATSRAVWGEYFTEWARGLGIQGIVIDGATRDASGIESSGFPLFARSTTARRPTLIGPGEVNVPVSCGGVCVLPGDIVVADHEGAIVIPLRRLDEVIGRIRKTAAGERTHHGVTAFDRQAFDAMFERSFGPMIAKTRRLGSPDSPDVPARAGDAPPG